MAQPTALDLSALLQPFADAPVAAGDDPRADTGPTSLYYKVKDARAAARAVERASIDLDAPVPEDWSTVHSSGITLLATRAKDLEIAAWLTEALVRTDGFAGLRDGFRLIAGLVDGFWDTLYPEIDEDDDGVEGRVAAVAGLNGSGAPGTIAQTLRTLPIVGVTRPMSIWNYDQANDFARITDPDRKAARLAAGSVTMEAFRESLAETPGRDLYETLTTIEEALAALAAMAESFDAVAGYDAPPTAALRELLEQIASAIRYFGAEKIAPHAKADATAEAPDPSQAATSEDTGDQANSVSSQAGLGPAPRTGGFASREEALDAVLKLADYFGRTEPQAPISYTLIEAVRRARLPLPELLAELSNDPRHIAYFRLAAGFRTEGTSPAIPDLDAPAPEPAPEPAVETERRRTSDGW